MLINVALSLAGNAIGLIVAAALLDDFNLSVSGFFIAVGIFTLAFVVLRPLVVKLSLKHSQALGGSSALIATLVALIITDIISDSVSISGFVTWLLATVIIWAVSLIAGFVLPAIFLKKAVTGAASGEAAAAQTVKTWGRG